MFYLFLKSLLSLCAGLALGGVYHPPTCKTVWDEKCWDEPRQQCDTVQKPYTSTVTDQKCSTQYDKQCKTVFDTKVFLCYMKLTYITVANLEGGLVWLTLSQNQYSPPNPLSNLILCEPR